MIPLEIHEYINKPVSEFPYALTEREAYRPNEKSYEIKEDFLFHGQSYSYMIITTTSNDIITEISFGVNCIFDESLYQKLVKEYGPPDKMLKKDKVTYQGKPSTINGITSTETQFTVKECTFEENPFKIMWNKERYTIELLLKQSDELTFKSIYVEIKKINID